MEWYDLVHGGFDGVMAVSAAPSFVSYQAPMLPGADDSCPGLHRTLGLSTGLSASLEFRLPKRTVRGLL